MSIAIVTDSTADVPPVLLEEFRISMMPNIIVIDGQEVIDNESFSREAFYERLPSMKTMPTTATASSGSYQQLYESIFEKGFARILSIHPSSLLSGIYNAAMAGSQAFNGQVQVIDSGQVTMGLGFQVLAAAEAQQDGLSFEKVLERIEDVRRRIKVIAMIDTLEYVRRSGRVSWARAGLGTLLRIKPFIEVKDGLVNSLGEARTRRKGLERLIHMIHALGPLERLAILHTNAEAEAQHFLECLEAKVTRMPPLVVNITTVIGAHVGPSCLGVAAVTQW
jgi:DegV family protein with EDD domain